MGVSDKCQTGATAQHLLRRVKLSDVTSLFIDGDWIESKDQSQSGFRLVQTGNIGVGEYLDKIDRAKYVSEATFARLKCTEIFAGDVLISRLPDPVGRACILPMLPQRAITAVDCSIVRFDSLIIEPKYFVYFSQSKEYDRQLSQFLTGSTRIRISRKNLQSIEVPIPPLPEQKRIAAELDNICAAKKDAEAIVEKLKQLAKSRFVEMFGDPVRNDMKWVTARLSELGELNRGVSKARPRNSPDLLGGPYPLVQTGEVSNAGLWITDYSSTYSEKGLAQSRMWKKGTLCITIAANIAQTAILCFDACFPDSVVGFIPNDRSNAIFIHYWFSFFQSILESQAPQVAQKNINLKILSNLEVIAPPAELQREFAAFIEQLDKSRLEAQALIDKLDLLYRAKLQEYFG